MKTGRLMDISGILYLIKIRLYQFPRHFVSFISFPAKILPI